LKYNKIVTFLAYIALLIPAIPPVFLPVFEPYTFGKIVLFEVVVTVMILFWIASLLKVKQKITHLFNSFKQNKLLLALGILGASFVISTLFSVNPYNSFWGSSARGDGLFQFAHFIFFFLIILNTIRSQTQWIKLITFSVFVSFFTALYAFAQWFEFPFVRQSLGEIFSTLGNPAFFATYLLFHIFLTLFAAQKEERREYRLFFCLIAIFEIIILLLTQVAAGIFALFVGLIIAAYPYFRTHISTKNGILILIGILIVIPLFLTNSYFEKITTQKHNIIALENRLTLWNIGFRSILDRPLLGYGPNYFEKIYLDHKAKGYSIPATGETFDKPHNVFIETAVSYGLLGLVFYVYLTYMLFKMVGLFHERERYIFYGLFTAYFIFLFFFFDTFSSYLLYFFLLAFIASRIHLGENTEKHKEMGEAPIDTTSFMIIAICFVIIFYVFHYKPLHNAYFAKQLFKREHSATELESAKSKALKYDAYNSSMIRNSIAVYKGSPD